MEKKTLRELRERGHKVNEAEEWTVGRLTAASRSADGLLKAAGHTKIDASLCCREIIMTYSIVAKDKKTGAVGIAVASRFFACGAMVPFVARGRRNSKPSIL